MKALLTSLLLTGFMAAAAQTLNVVEGPVTYRFPASQTGIMPYSGGATLTVMSRDFCLGTITSAYVDMLPVEDNLVTVCYGDALTTVTVAGNIAQYIDVTAVGSDISIVQSQLVDDTTCGEITYRLSGSCANGSFTMSGAYKATVELNGLSLASNAKAPVDMQNGKRIKLIVADGTQNKLTDSEGGTQKGCISSKGHLEISGSGSLSIAGLTGHAIYAKEYIEFAEASVTIEKAVKDGLNCNQYFKMSSGSLAIDGVGDDGIQVSFKDDVNREAEDTGSFFIIGGKITATSTADASKAIKTDGNIEINGGELLLKVSGNGIWDSTKAKTKASSCLNADGTMTIHDGILNLTAAGSGGKGVSCDSVLTINGGEITVMTSGGITAYVNSQLMQNYTGNTDRIDSDYKSSPKGIKSDNDIVINGGTINVTTTGHGAEGIESKAVLTINDGNITVKAYDDAINSSSHMYINGGTISVIATNNDGLDSNGNLYLKGGTVRAFGATSPECGIDANEEGGYTVVFSGGKLLAVGGGNSTPSSSSGSTQPYVSSSGSVTANTVIKVSNGTETLAEFTVPSGYTGGSQGGRGNWGGPGGGGGSSILITCPELVNGQSYTLTNGSSSSSVSAVITGSSRPW